MESPQNEYPVDEDLSSSTEEALTMNNSNLETFRKRTKYNLIAIPVILLALVFLLNGTLSNAYAWASSSDPDIRAESLLRGGTFFLGALLLLGLSILYFIWLTRGLALRSLKKTKSGISARSNLFLELPLRRRMTTLVYAVPLFAILDFAFAFPLITLFRVYCDFFSTNGGFASFVSILLTGVILIASIAILLYIEIAYVNWVVTKNWPRSLSELRDWSKQP